MELFIFNVELGAKSHTFHKEQLKTLFIMSFSLFLKKQFSGLTEEPCPNLASFAETLSAALIIY